MMPSYGSDHLTSQAMWPVNMNLLKAKLCSVYVVIFSPPGPSEGGPKGPLSPKEEVWRPPDEVQVNPQEDHRHQAADGRSHEGIQMSLLSTETDSFPGSFLLPGRGQVRLRRLQPGSATECQQGRDVRSSLVTTGLSSRHRSRWRPRGTTWPESLYPTSRPSRWGAVWGEGNKIQFSLFKV